MSSRFPRRPLALAACLFPLAATAQSTPPQPTIPTLQDIIVTASRSAEPLADAVGDVTVIGPRQLQAARGESIAQIIAQAPGVQLATNGGPQTQTGLFIRGSNADHVLVLMDGIPINGATSGIAQFSSIDPALVERIEILRGAASSLYGSDAIGGVVNIITKKGNQDRPLSAWANVGFGSYNTAKSSLGLSGASHGWDYSLSSSAATSDGFDATNRYTADNSANSLHYPDKDGYRSHALSGTLGYQWAAGHHIGLTAYNGYIDGDYDSGASTPNTYALYRQQAYSLTSEDRLTSWWTSNLRFGFAKDSYDDRSDYPSLTDSLKRTYSWTNTFKLATHQQIAVLLERQEERIASTTLYDQDARDVNAAALIYKGQFKRLHTQASIRNDDYTSYGNQVTGNLGADFDLSDSWTIGVAGGTAFHAPTFNDLYYPGFSNPNLKPEKSRNIEAHIAYTHEHSQARLTVYQNRVRDLIVAAAPSYIPLNVGSATLRGLTLEGSHDFGATTMRGSVDLLDPHNDDPAPGENSQLIRRARQVFHLSAEHRIRALKFGAEYQYTGNRYDGSGTSQVSLGGYSLVNLTAAYDITKSLGVQVRWNNVFDKNYVLVDGYNTPGSNVFVNLSWKM